MRIVAKTICTYQPPIAHAAIDAGADLILGHHAHSIKQIEVYKGKVCFYSIGNFMTSGAPKAGGERLHWNLLWLKTDPECAPPNGMYNFPSHCRMTMLAKAVMGKKGIERVSFYPAYINPRAQPYQVKAGDPLDLVVNGCLIAQGEVVIVNNQYGIRLTDIVSPSERLRRTSR